MYWVLFIFRALVSQNRPCLLRAANKNHRLFCCKPISQVLGHGDMCLFFDDARTSMGSLQTCSGSFSRRAKLDRSARTRFRRKGVKRALRTMHSSAKFSKFRALESPVGSVFQDGTVNLVLNIQCHVVFFPKGHLRRVSLPSPFGAILGTSISPPQGSKSFQKGSEPSVFNLATEL